MAQRILESLSAVRSVTGTVKNISDDDIINAYRLFLKKLEKHFRDSIIQTAMEEYWKKKNVSGWHFVRQQENIRSYW